MRPTRFPPTFYYAQMLQLYGPFPIVDKTVDYSNTGALPTNRNTEEECVGFIVSELDKCIAALPEKEKVLAAETGRPSREAAMALKATVLLWDASPLVNGNPDYSGFKDAKGRPYFSPAADPQKWKKAADAAKAVIDLGKYDLYTVPANTGYVTVPLGNFPGNDVAWPNGPAGIDPYRSFKGLFSGGKSYWNQEVIWAVNVPDQSQNLSLLGFPRNYNNGEGATSTAVVYATQKLVVRFFHEQRGNHYGGRQGPVQRRGHFRKWRRVLYQRFRERGAHARHHRFQAVQRKRERYPAAS